MPNFQAHYVQVFFKPKKKMVHIHHILRLKQIPLRKSQIFDPFVVRENVKGG